MKTFSFPRVLTNDITFVAENVRTKGDLVYVFFVTCLVRYNSITKNLILTFHFVCQ